MSASDSPGSGDTTPRLQKVTWLVIIGSGLVTIAWSIREAVTSSTDEFAVFLSILVALSFAAYVLGTSVSYE